MFIKFTDKVKKIFSGILLVNSLGLGYFGYAIYSSFTASNGVVVDGSPYLPEYFITFEPFSGNLFLSAGGCCIMTILGILASFCKKP